MTAANDILKFLKGLTLTKKLPDEVAVMNPYQDKMTFDLCRQFYKKYYSDSNKRTLILGINPGRFGAGLTGIPFTDPVKLEAICGIPNTLQKKVELSADFIYAMIEAYGGPEKFYGTFLISSVSPLGFTKDNKNVNYYDIKALQLAITDFSVDCLQKQLAFNTNHEFCFCLGEGYNYKFLNDLNRKHNFFKTIIPLPHPRFIMQYRRKQVQAFIRMYVARLSARHD